MEVKKKNCNVCGIEFESKGGAAKCQKCRAAYLRAWKLAHPEKVDAYAEAYQKNNGEYIRLYKKEHRAANPEMYRESLREWKGRNPEKVLADGRKQDSKRLRNETRKKYMKDLRLRRAFDLTLETYNQILQSQNGVCAICNKSETHLDRSGRIRHLCVDHCHKSGKVRQLLCNRCNAMLGRAEDDIERLKNAVIYLEKHSESKSHSLP